MKKILSLLFCLASLVALSQCPQCKVGGIIINDTTGTTGGGGGTFTPTNFARINLTVSAGSGSNPANWNNVGANDAQVAAGGIGFSNLINSVGTITGYSFTSGTTNWLSTYDGFTPAEAGQAAGSGVFPDLVEGWGWKFNEGATFTISGLTSGTTYGMNMLFNAANFENATCSFTIAGTTSPTIDDGLNFGSSATTPFYTDPALSRITFTASGSSVIVTLHVSPLNASFGIVAAIVLGYQ